MKISQIIALIFTLLFAALGSAFWAVPENLARYFDIETAGDAGLITMRADFGGFFVGIALLCAIGAITKRAPFLFAVALVLSTVVIGRLIGLIVGGTGGATNLQLASLAFEVVTAAVLFLSGRNLRNREKVNNHRKENQLKF